VMPDSFVDWPRVVLIAVVALAVVAYHAIDLMVRCS
jgi:hypothetical protein